MSPVITGVVCGLVFGGIVLIIGLFFRLLNIIFNIKIPTKANRPKEK